MIYINELLREKQGFKGRLLDYISPEQYAAFSVKDFCDYKDQIQGTPLWKALLLAWVPIVGCAVGCAVGELRGKALVDFANVELEIHDDIYGDASCIISDQSGSMWVDIDPFPFAGPSARRKNLSDGRYYQVVLQYEPKYGSSRLYSTKKEGPPEEDRSPSIESVIGRLCLANVNNQ